MAPEYLSPGVYVEEVSSGNKPIEAVSTSTVGFVGQSRKGPVNEVVFCPNWTTFTKSFGDFADSEYLAHAVYGFFNNGGARCFILNVGVPDDGADDQKPARFIGFDNGPGERGGLHAFEEVPEINIVCAPGQTDPAITDAVLTHCEKMRYRMAILDAPETIEKGGVDKLPKPRDSKYGAYYFPWIEVYDPTRGNIYIPPSGHVAGIFARTDAERGVHKAPANEIVRGALGLKYNITKGEQDILNPKGINCIRSFPNRGIRVWGARTISSDPEWRYVNVRRLFNMVEESIENGTQWVVFEPNDQTLWKRVQRNITAFLLRVWRDGALFGGTPEQAFYVKCDAETNPPEVIDAGQLVVEIGMCPVKPAEFVIFRIGQMPTGGDVSE
jgi:phage tail sheath protein FI